MRLYKLTDQDWLTRPGEWNQTLWGPGVTNRVMTAEEIFEKFNFFHEKKPRHERNKTSMSSIQFELKLDSLCSVAWIHAYVCPEAAAAFNMWHADIRNPVLWVCDFKGEVKFDGNNKEKVGVKELTTIKIINMPGYDFDRTAFTIRAFNKYDEFKSSYEMKQQENENASTDL